jgi:RND superfamily putative drug exporter
MLRRLARWCVRHRRIVVFAIWLPLLVGVNAVAGSVGSAFSTDFSFPDSESAKVIELLESVNPERAGFTGQIVVEAPQGVDHPEVRAAFEAVMSGVEAMDGVSVDSPYDNPNQISQDGTIAFAQVNVSDRDQAEFLQFAEDVQELDDAFRSGPERVPGLRFEYGGEIFAEFELPEAEVLGLIGAMIILIVAFGSVLAMGLPIGTALFGLGVGTAIVTLASHFAAMPDFTVQMVAMIGLGVGIDYALFIVTRYREGLAGGLDVEDAIVEAIDTSGRAVLFAGITVLISLCGLFLMGLSFMNGLAIGAISGVLMMMAGAVTLLPALLAMVGRRIDVTTRAALASVILFIAGAITWVATGRPAILLAGLVLAIGLYAISFAVKPLRQPLPHRAPKPADQTFWFRWSRVVLRRPWPVLATTVGVLVLLAIPLFSIRLGFSDTGNLHERQTARRAYDLLAEGFGPGISGPIVFVVEGADAADPARLDGLVQTLNNTEGVQFASPAAPLSADLAMITAFPTSSPQDAETADLVHRLRDEVIPASGVDALVGGWTAAGIDFADYLGDRLPILIAAVLILSFVLLLVVFRSVLVPLKAVILNLLSIGAAYGALVAIFQWGWGKELIGVGREGPIEAWAPMMLFAIVFGLSMDYEVFLLSRIKEHYDKSRNNEIAVADGLAATARVITAAALIMVCVFSAFVLGEDRQLKLFGLGMAIAVLIDATVVRMLLVPATMELLGDRNWWMPKWLDRLLPKIDVEGHHTVDPVDITHVMPNGDSPAGEAEPESVGAPRG